MVIKRDTVVWTRRSQLNLKQAHYFISKQSVQNAFKVLEDIIKGVEKAIDNPETYNKVKYKINNDGSYRAFEIHHYRVAYRYGANVIRILRIRHTSLEPKVY